MLLRRQFNAGVLLTKRSQLTPDAVGVVVGEQATTYREMNSRSNRWVHAFHDSGVRKADRVGTLLKNCAEFLEVYFGLAKMGAVFVPLDARLTPRELEYVAKNSDLTTLIFDMELAESVEAIKPNLGIGDYIHVGKQDAHVPAWARDANLIGDYPSTEPKVVAGGEDPLFILYSSGVTGTPNGVVRTHRGHLYASLSVFGQHQKANESVTRVLIPIPLFHGFGLEYITGSVHAGCTNVLVKKFDALTTLRTIQEKSIETFPAVPSMLQSMTQIPNFEKCLSSLRFVTSGGASLPTRLIKLYEQHGVEICNAYGLAECGTVSATTLEDAVRKAGSAGVPFSRNKVRIIDDDGIQAPAGKIGEILVKGPAVMTEYWRHPQTTSETIKEGWVHSGDLGFLDNDGYLYVVDRRKDCIVSGAEKIYPAEIENVLSTHPKIAEAAAVGLPDDLWGQIVCAVACARVGETLTSEEVIDFCKGKLAPFKIPKRVFLVDHPLPRNTAGKLLRRVLREQLSAKR